MGSIPAEGAMRKMILTDYRFPETHFPFSPNKQSTAVSFTWGFALMRMTIIDIPIVFPLSATMRD